MITLEVLRVVVGFEQQRLQCKMCFIIQEFVITGFYAAWRVNIHSRQRSLQESACQPDASASVSHFVWTTLAPAPLL